MVVSFLVAVTIVLAMVILRAYSFAEDTARSVAKAERERLQDENPDHAVAALDEEAFIAYFEWLRRRRFWLYLLGFLVLATLETLLVMAILSFVHIVFYPGPWMWGFIAVFVLTAGWSAVVWGVLWFHRRQLDAAVLKNLKRWPGMSAQDV